MALFSVVHVDRPNPVDILVISVNSQCASDAGYSRDVAAAICNELETHYSHVSSATFLGGDFCDSSIPQELVKTCAGFRPLQETNQCQWFGLKPAPTWPCPGGKTPKDELSVRRDWILARTSVSGVDSKSLKTIQPDVSTSKGEHTCIGDHFMISLRAHF